MPTCSDKVACTWDTGQVTCALAGLQAMQMADFEERVKAAEDFGAKSRWRKRAISCVPTKFGISFTTKFLNQAGALVHSACTACGTVGTGRSNCTCAHCSLRCSNVSR
jgi:Molybdopterin-binding domain of aldehyde dehydrogenase